MTPVLQFNRRHPRFALRAEIRVWSGREAPDWVKELGGGPVTVAHGKNKVQIPRFWTAEYRHAWSKLQDQLAGQFDAQPEVASVTNTLGASISDDPFLLPTDAVSIKNLRAAGFTDAAYEACLSGAAEACKSWKHTAVIYPFNTFISIGGGRAKSKPDVAPRIMRKFRQDFGTRAVLSNQSLQASPPIEVKRLYAEMKRLGAPIQLQVCVPDEHQWEAAIKYGASIGATTIELHPRSGPANNQHGFSVMKREELLKLDRVLFGN